MEKFLDNKKMSQLVELGPSTLSGEQFKTSFIFNLGQKIRTTFAGIHSISTLLEDQERDPGKKSLINAISQSSQELFDYCSTILDFSKRELPIAGSFNLKELISRILRLEKAALLNQNTKVIEKYLADAPVLFSGDEYKIERILLNIISNAVRFTHEGQIEISVSLVKVLNEEECLIEVMIKDTGAGIPNDKILHIKNLIDGIKGEIKVESQLGKGTTFNCLFRLCYRVLLPEKSEAI